MRSSATEPVISIFGAIGISLVFAACTQSVSTPGAGHADAGAPDTSAPDSHIPDVNVPSGTYEYSVCSVPLEMSIVRELESSLWKSNRYFRASSSDIMHKYIGAVPKNPEGDITHGPGFVSNCTPSASGTTQLLTYNFKTTNYFSSGVAGFLVAILRADFPTSGVGSGDYDGIGIAMFPNASLGASTLGARYNVNYPAGGCGVFEQKTSTMSFHDGIVYRVEIQATSTTVSYKVTNLSNTADTTGWDTFSPNLCGVPVRNDGYALAVGCADQNAACEINTPWRLDMTEASSSWF
jgi:hypothetical protein